MTLPGEFRVCVGCAEWMIMAQPGHKGPVCCCQACAQGLRCTCMRGEESPHRMSGRPLYSRHGGRHGNRESESA